MSKKNQSGIRKLRRKKAETIKKRQKINRLQKLRTTTVQKND